MPLSWNEIKSRAALFSTTWRETTREEAVDLSCRHQSINSEAKQFEYLFELYEKYTGGLFQPVKKSKKKTKSIADETH